MGYRITLDPRLGLSAFDFIITWNATPACRAAAMARTSAFTPVRFEVDRVAGTSIVLTGVDPATGAGAVPDLICEAMEKRGIRREITKIDAGPEGIFVTLAD